MLRRIRVPEQNQRIFQSDAAALEETLRGHGVALTVSFVVARDVAQGGSCGCPARGCRRMRCGAC